MPSLRKRVGVATACAATSLAGAALQAIAVPVPAWHLVSNADVVAGTTRGDALRITGELTSLAAELRAHPGRAASVATRVRAIAGQRRAVLLDLMRNNPELVQSFLLSDSAQADLDRVDAQDIEAKVALHGDIEVIAGSGGTQHLLLRAGQAPLLVYSSGQLPGVSRRDVAFTGYVLGNSVFIEAAGGAAAAVSTGGSSAVTSGMVGTINATVIVSYFTDTTDPFSMGNIAATFNGHAGSDVDSFFSEVSYGKTTLVPSFHGPYQLSMTQATGCASINTLAQASINAASASVTYANVQRLVYVVDCPNLGSWAGVGTYSINTPQGTIQASESWINVGNETSPYGYAHELGHNAGFQHSDWADCAPDVFDPPTNFGPTCPAAPYGDSFDTMGTAPFEWVQTPHYDAYHKYLAGWFSAANFPTVSAPGTTTYTLSPIESASSGTIALDIPRGDSGTSFTVEYRQPVGFDSWLSTCGSTCNVTQGASIKLVGGYASSADVHGLDMTPGSQPSSGYWDGRDYYRDQALLAGQTFTDPEYGIQVAAVAASTSGLTVQVSIPSQTCTHTSPAVAVSPVNTSVAPGQTATWSVTITNRYSAGCPAAKFRFRAYGAHGSSAYTDPGVVTIASGASATVTMSLPVPATLPYGTYSDQGFIEANAIADQGTTFTYGYTVGGPSDSGAPTPPQHLAATASGARLVTLRWLPASDAVGLGGYRIYRNDALLTPASVSTSTFLDTTASPSTAYTYRVVAVNWGGVSSAYSNTATVTTPAVTDTTPPADVPGVVDTAVGSHDVQLAWRPASDNTGVGYYAVVRDSMPVDYPATTTGVDVGDLWSSQPFTFYVLAYDADGNASNLFDAVNAELKVSTGASGTTAPLAPSMPQATTVTPAQVALSWAPVAGAAGYTIYRNLIRITSVSGTTYTDSGVSPSGCEIYTVAAYDSSGNVSGLSPQNAISVASASASTIPPSASISSPASGSTVSGTITVAAGAADPAGIQSVQLLVDDVPKASLTTGPYDISLDTATLTNGPHTLVVLANGNDGDTGASTPVSVSVNNTDTTPPSAPTSPQAAAGGATTVDLSWAASTDNVGVAGYAVFRNGSKVGTTTTSSFADTGLAASTSPSYQVQAYDAAGNVSPLSGAVSATTLPADTKPPAAPTGLAAASASPSQIVLSWTASTDNVGVAGYSVYRVSAGGTFTLAGTSAGTGFTDGGLASGTAYTYYVQANDAAGNVSGASNQASATPQAADTQPPTAPWGLSATAGSASQINLSWGASSDNVGVAGYRVYRSSGGVPFAQVGATAASTTSYSDAALAAGTTYTYDVVAFDAAGNVSSPSNQASATTQAPDTQPPTAPASLTATAQFASSIDLTWAASTDNVGVVGYDVYRSSGGSPFTQVASIAASATSFADSGLTSATTYVYYVVAYDAAGNVSSPSSQASATTAHTQVQPSTGVLNGTVSGGGGPISGATVTVTVNGTTMTATTNGSGAYTVSGVPAGTWTVAYSARRYVSTKLSVTVTGGATTTQNVTLAKSH